MPVWTKDGHRADLPAFLAALVTVGWSNSHSMGVQAALISYELTEDVEQLERQLETLPTGDAMRKAMTTFNITLPLDRTSPVRIPIRDLVLGGTDSWHVAGLRGRSRQSRRAADRFDRRHRRPRRFAVHLA